MAFTGTPAITYVSDNKVRITGLSLAAAASGTISLAANSSGEVELSPTVDWDRYRNARGEMIELDDSVKCSVIKAEAGLSTTEACSVVKSGNGPTDFLITINNPDAAASGALEIWVEYH